MSQSTDQIQSKLYHRSDAATKRKVDAAVGALQTFVNANVAYNHEARIPLGLSKVHKADGEKFHSNMPPEEALRALNHGAYVRVSMHDLLTAMRTTLCETLKEADRKAYVEAFLADVERLRTEVDELQDRVAGLED